MMRAARSNPIAPDFTGLEAYMCHLPSAETPLRTPDVDFFIQEAQKTEAHLMRQHRLMREQASADRRRPAGGNPDGQPSAKSKPMKKKKEVDDASDDD